MSLDSNENMVVHLHGSRVGLIPFMFRRMLIPSSAASTVKFVYTLHDYSYEIEHSLLIDSIQLLFPRIHMSTKSRGACRVNQSKFTYTTQPRKTDDKHICAIFCICQRVYISGLAIEESDAVTFVSKFMSRKIVTESEPFKNSEMITAFLRTATFQRRFFGISNGVDLFKFNPFTNSRLMELGLNFHTKFLNFRSICDSKQLAKNYLSEKLRLIPSTAKGNLIILFIGRFEYRKGFGDCIQLLTLCRQLGLTLILMGQKDDVSLDNLLKFQLRYPETLVILEGNLIQKKVGIFVRAAADFSFIPSRTESFGLIAVESLLFGQIPISTGVGGLSEILQKRSGFKKDPLTGRPHASFGNAYLYHTGNATSLRAEFHQAISDYHNLREAGLIESFQRSLIKVSFEHI